MLVLTSDTAKPWELRTSVPCRVRSETVSYGVHLAVGRTEQAVELAGQDGEFSPDNPDVLDAGLVHVQRTSSPVHHDHIHVILGRTKSRNLRILT